MLDAKLTTFLTVCETKNFTRAAELLSLTQPAVSHHIAQLEQELGVRLFYRKRGDFRLTAQGEIALRYARRISGLYNKMSGALEDARERLTKLRVGITHTAESSVITEAFAKYASETPGLTITIVTDTMNNLYELLANYELDIAVVEGELPDPTIQSLLLDTDYLVCILPNNSPLAKKSLVTLDDLRGEKLILRLPNSGTRLLLDSHLERLKMSIRDFNIALEVDNVATIKDLVRKDFGISILPRSACLDELNKSKLTALPIENLSMIRETNLLYNRDFGHDEVLQAITRIYHSCKP